MSWFTNRGQFLQLVVAVVALIVGVVGVTASLRAIHIIEFSDFNGLLIYLLLIAASFVAFVLVFAAACFLIYSIYFTTLAIFVRRRRVAWLEIDCEVGELCEREIAGIKYRLTVHSVRKGHKETAPYVADVEVIKGTELSLIGGCDTKENGENRFWMPVTPSHRTVTGGIYELGIHEAVLKISVVRIDHINLASGKVTLTLCAISWRL